MSDVPNQVPDDFRSQIMGRLLNKEVSEGSTPTAENKQMVCPHCGKSIEGCYSSAVDEADDSTANLALSLSRQNLLEKSVAKKTEVDKKALEEKKEMRNQFLSNVDEKTISESMKGFRF